MENQVCKALKVKIHESLYLNFIDAPIDEAQLSIIQVRIIQVPRL